MKDSGKKLLFSVDVEDYFSLVARDKLGLQLPISQHVEDETARVLDLLDELNIQATCFVVGRLAVEKPQVVRELIARGHDVASHGHEHLWMPQLTPRKFADDLRTSIQALQDVTGRPVLGFRAPVFSLREEQSWAFEIMAGQGIQYDSSVHVVWPFGIPLAEDLIRMAAGYGIREYPGFAVGWRRWRIPVAGGGGLRLLPHAFTRWAANRIMRTGYDVPVYLHPYDLRLERHTNWPARGSKARFRLGLFEWSQHLGRSNVAERLSLLASLAGPLRARINQEEQ